MSEAEEQISELENKMVEITSEEQNKDYTTRVQSSRQYDTGRKTEI